MLLCLSFAHVCSEYVPFLSFVYMLRFFIVSLLYRTCHLVICASLMCLALVLTIIHVRWVGLARRRGRDWRDAVTP